MLKDASGVTNNGGRELANREEQLTDQAGFKFVKIVNKDLCVNLLGLADCQASVQ